jgi:hypothetical protein
MFTLSVFYIGTLRHAELVSRWDIVDTGEGFENDVWEVKEPQQTTALDWNDGAASALGVDPNIVVVIGVSTFCSTKRDVFIQRLLSNIYA